jgi:hypothetical protein
MHGINGWTVGVDQGAYILGRNADVDGAETIWPEGGNFPWASIDDNATTTFVSSSGDDTAAGSGAQSIIIEGLMKRSSGGLTGYQITTEILPLNGATPVESVNDYAFVYRMRVATAGAGLNNAGTIQAKHGATVIDSMTIGRNQSESGVMIVPQFTTQGTVIQGAFPVDVYASITTVASAYVSGSVRWALPGTNTFADIFTTTITPEAPVFERFRMIPRFAPGSKFELRANEVSAANQVVFAGLHLSFD